MDVSDRGAEVLVQLISPEELPVCECLHHEEQRKLTDSTSKKRSSSAESQQGVLLFLRSWHPPYFIFFVSVLEVRQSSANLLSPINCEVNKICSPNTLSLKGGGGAEGQIGNM